ncbi:MAG: MFS transporter [Mesoaciditoga sp.]|uniref:MFS transporter n=1 Tax=Athalassotoga sp. TaxID=2022597 RepID=UPI000CADB18F|nr:MAG: MFS transporter [Mesoaciditoga sp.]PMP80871.1 MAG: MFS transporter [Mesoaciditoga sp.]HEU23989.1 MFS transporter [Mesoaciditoga lauensis]
MNKKRLTDFFAINSSMLSMLTLVIMVGMGQYMGDKFLPLYLITLGGGAISIGVLNGMQNLLGAIYSFPGGYLSDKIGYKKSLIFFTIFSMIGYTIVIILPAWQYVLIGAIFFIAWSAIAMPAIMSLISDAVPKNKRVMGVSMHSLVRRVPMALGPIIGGILINLYGITNGIRISFIIAMVFAIVSIFIFNAFIKDSGKKSETVRIGSMLKNLSGNLRTLLVSDIFVRFCEQIPYAFVVVWVVEKNGLSALQFGILTAIEMITAMIIYVPVAYLADRHTKKPFVVITFVFFTLFPLVLLFSRSFELLVIAFIIKGLKEFGEPTRKSLIMDLSPEGQKAGTFGAYYLIRDGIVSVAAFLSAFLWLISPMANFLTAFAFGLLGTFIFLLFGKSSVKAS